MFEPSSDEFIVKVVKEPDDVKKLLEVGFERLRERGPGVSKET
jgi:hypothetical protein